MAVLSVKSYKEIITGRDPTIPEFRGTIEPGDYDSVFIVAMQQGCGEFIQQ
jgi:hypothetical protein